MICNSKQNSIQYLVSKGAINDVRKVIDRDLFDKLNDSLTRYAETKYGLDTMGAQLFTAATEQTRYLKDTPAYRESTYSIKRAVPNEVLFERLDQLVTQYENRSDTDQPMMMRGDIQSQLNQITQDDKSYYRGQIEEPTILANGDLVLYGREDELYKRAGLKSKGISMTDDLKSAINYGEGQFEGAQLRFEDLWGYDINTWAAEDAYIEMMNNGYWLIQIPKNISNEIIREAGEVKIIGDKIIIPKGQYKIEQISESEYTEPTLPIFEFDAGTVVNARSKEVATVLANRLALGLKVNYYNITEQEAREILKNSKIPYQGEPAFFFAGTVYTVGENVNLNTVLH